MGEDDAYKGKGSSSNNNFNKDRKLRLVYSG